MQRRRGKGKGKGKGKRREVVFTLQCVNGGPELDDRVCAANRPL
jgi:hypothetical protein